MIFETAQLVDAAMNFAMALTHPMPSSGVQGRSTEPSRMAMGMLADWDGALPVDVHGLCARLGVPVQKVAMADEGVAARLCWNDGFTNAGVSVNAELSEHAQRFAIAQALGAILLRSPTVVEVSASAPRAADGAAQRADAFALHLLIPARGLGQMVARFRTEEALSQVYAVAPRKIMTRLIARALSGR